MDLLIPAATVGLAMASASHAASIALAMRRVGRRRRRPGPLAAAGVSILRPVCGLEYRSEATLASSFQIDHPSYEVIFCVAAADDPVVPVVRRLMREHPEVPARLLVGGEGGGPNPKLANLVKAWEVVAHDWIVLADSNVLMPPDYLDRLFARWTERSQLAVDELGFGFVQGKTILLRRSDLAGEGGLAALAREVAEDAAATKLARRWGRKVGVVDQPFPQPLGRRCLAGVWQRQLRWARLRRASFPGWFCAELPAGGVFPFLLASYLAIAGVLPWAGVGALMLAWYGAEAALARAFGWPLRVRSPLFWIARDLLLPVLWFHTWAAKDYQWRGTPVDLRPAKQASRTASGSTRLPPRSTGSVVW